VARMYPNHPWAPLYRAQWERAPWSCARLVMFALVSGLSHMCCWECFPLVRVIAG
jgi:hypothetical protein